MDGNLKYNRKEMEEHLPDYIFGKLEESEKIIFEQSLPDYPDLISEIFNVNEVFTELNKIDFNKIADNETRDMSGRVLSRLRMQERRNATFKNTRINSMRYLIPAIAAMLLIVVASQFIIWNQSKVQMSESSEIVDKLFEEPTPKVLELTPKEKATLDKSISASSEPVILHSNMPVLNNSNELNEIIDEMYSEFVASFISDLDNHQVERVISTISYSNNFMQDLQNIDENDLQNILNEVENAEIIF